MSSPDEPAVEVLTDEIRVLQVGSKLITLSRGQAARLGRRGRD
jgi:hypothetical protein